MTAAKARPAKRASRRPPPPSAAPAVDPAAPYGTLQKSLADALESLEQSLTLLRGIYDTARRLGL